MSTAPAADIPSPVSHADYSRLLAEHAELSAQLARANGERFRLEGENAELARQNANLIASGKHQLERLTAVIDDRDRLASVVVWLANSTEWDVYQAYDSYITAKDMALKALAHAGPAPDGAAAGEPLREQPRVEPAVIVSGREPSMGASGTP